MVGPNKDGAQALFQWGTVIDEYLSQPPPLCKFPCVPTKPFLSASDKDSKNKSLYATLCRVPLRTVTGCQGQREREKDESDKMTAGRRFNPPIVVGLGVMNLQ